MTIDENTGGVITLKEAQDYVKAYKERYPEEVKAFFIGSVNVNKILEQENCIGIRIYNGYDVVESRLNQVLVGVDSDERDMTEGIIMDQLKPCPNFCDTRSALMVS